MATGNQLLLPLLSPLPAAQGAGYEPSLPDLTDELGARPICGVALAGDVDEVPKSAPALRFLGIQDCRGPERQDLKKFRDARPDCFVDG